jgi:hypothetical protein
MVYTLIVTQKEILLQDAIKEDIDQISVDKLECFLIDFFSISSYRVQ